MVFKAVYSDEQYETARDLWLQGDMTCVEIGRATGVSVGAVYGWVSRYWRRETVGLHKSAEAIDIFLRRSA